MSTGKWYTANTISKGYWDVANHHADTKGGGKMKVIEGFGDRLQKAIWDKNMSNEEVVRKTKISRSCLYGYVNSNMMPTCSNLVKLSNLLEVSTDYLLGL